MYRLGLHDIDESIDADQDHHMNAKDVASYEFIEGFLKEAIKLSGHQEDYLNDPEMDLT